MDDVNDQQQRSRRRSRCPWEKPPAAVMIGGSEGDAVCVKGEGEGDVSRVRAESEQSGVGGGDVVVVGRRKGNLR